MNKSSFPGNPDISLVIKAVICFIVSTVCLILPACSEEKDAETPARQTLLVYLIGDNDLYPYLNENLDAIEEGVKNTDDFSCNLLIYIDSYRELPYLYKIEKDKHGNVSSHIIKEYPEQNSADKEIMSAIIQDVLGSYPAEQTGLILGSHATSWFPQDFLTITSRSFGDDNGAVMEIDELAEALPIKKQNRLHRCVLFRNHGYRFPLFGYYSVVIGATTSTGSCSQHLLLFLQPEKGIIQIGVHFCCKHCSFE